MGIKNLIQTAGLLLTGAFFLLAGCSSDSAQEANNIAAKIIDSVVISAVDATFASANEPEAVATEPDNKSYVGEASNGIADMTIVGDKLYAVSGEMLTIYDFVDKSHEDICVDDNLGAVAMHSGQIYVGGANLWQLDGSVLNRIDEKSLGVITSLYSYGDRLMVGTAVGLYATDVLGQQLLLDDVEISALAADKNGLWIGTAGDGLYRWDGDNIRKRYLVRDTALFDTVNALQFEHHHLYMGTTNGLHVFDGGRWETLTMADNLPSNNVTTIDASRWVVFVGTDAGVVTFFDNEIKPVAKLVDKSVNVVRVRKTKVVVGTDSGQLLVKSGPVLKELIVPAMDIQSDTRADIY